MGRGDECDEELAAVGAASAALSGVCHRQDAGRVVAQAGVEFVVELVAGAAAAGAVGIAALRHKAGDYAVKGYAVVVAFAR